MIVRDPELIRLYECRNRIAWLTEKPLLCLQCGEKFELHLGHSWYGYNAYCHTCFEAARKEHDMSPNEYINQIRKIGKATKEFIEGKEEE